MLDVRLAIQIARNAGYLNGANEEGGEGFSVLTAWRVTASITQDKINYRAIEPRTLERDGFESMGELIIARELLQPLGEGRKREQRTHRPSCLDLRQDRA